MYDKSLEMKLAIYASERTHPFVASTYHQLERVYEDQGKLEYAEEMIRKSFDMYVATVGSEMPQPSFATTLNTLGRLLERHGKRRWPTTCGHLKCIVQYSDRIPSTHT